MKHWRDGGREEVHGGRGPARAPSKTGGAPLSRAELRFDALVDALDEAVIVEDISTGLVTRCNDAAAQLLGYDRNELVGLPSARLFVEGDAPGARRGGPAGEGGGRGGEREARLRRRDGGTAAVRCRVVGAAGERLVVLRDVGGPRRAEELLARSQERFRRLVDRINDGLVAVDASGAVTFVNRRLCRILGFGPDELIGRPYADLFDPASVEAATAARASCEPREVDMRRKDGRLLTVRIASESLDDADGPGASLVLVTDVTEHRKTEAALVEKSMYLDSILRSAIESAIVTTDLDFTITYYNPRAEQIYGYAASEVIGRSVHQIHEKVGVDEERFRRGIENVRRCGEHRYTVEQRREDGGVRTIEARVSGIYGAGGELVGYALFGTDVTARIADENLKRELREQLFQAQKMEAIGRLAGGVAHDFTNLLTAIKALTYSSMSKVRRGSPLYEGLKKIRSTAERGATLIRQLLLFSRKQPTELKVLDINETIGGLLNILAPVIGEDISVETELDSELWPVLANESNIEQVIMNLAVNARDAMPDGGVLTIRTENRVADESFCKTMPGAEPGRYVCIVIEDTGVGMDEEVRRHIFEPFFTTKGSGKGTGLGLSVVYGIVKEHDGLLGVTSEPGKGTSFTVCLRAAEGAASRAAAATRRDEPGGGGERILVVEDEAVVRESLRMALVEKGYRISEAANGGEALELLEDADGAVDLLFSDLVLPDMSGLSLAERARKTRPDLAVLLCSGYTDRSIDWRSLRENRIGFIQKPYDIPDLLAAIKGIIDSS
ncbi:MAG TPA: PAS domain S-box protein [Deltaproteobacteria bacterium]|nr:PAS domain S-box protein [Deltaproteobacteria bacterium]